MALTLAELDALYREHSFDVRQEGLFVETFTFKNIPIRQLTVPITWTQPEPDDEIQDVDFEG